MNEQTKYNSQQAIYQNKALHRIYTQLLKQRRNTIDEYKYSNEIIRNDYMKQSVLLKRNLLIISLSIFSANAQTKELAFEPASVTGSIVSDVNQAGCSSEKTYGFINYGRNKQLWLHKELRKIAANLNDQQLDSQKRLLIDYQTQQNINFITVKKTKNK